MTERLKNTADKRKPIIEKLVMHIGSCPKLQTPEEINNVALRLLQAHQDYIKSTQGSNLLRKKINAHGTIMGVQVGDIHTGSPVSDYQAINEIRDTILKTPGAFAFFTGDIIEALNPTKGAIAWSALDINSQISAAKYNTIDPLLDRTIAGVYGHHAHEGHIDIHGISPAKLMYPPNILLQQGGVVEIEWGKSKAAIELWHKKGGRGVQPTRGLSEIALKTDTRSRSNYYGAAHDHESYVNKQYTGKNCNEVPVVAVKNGTIKGSNSTLPRDSYGIALGVGLADPLGQGGIFRPNIINGKETGTVDVYPFHTLTEGVTLNFAFKILDIAEKQKVREELIAEIYSKTERPRINTSLKKSTEVGRALVECEESGNNYVLEKQWDRVVIDIKTILPIALWPIQNVRWGSTYGGQRELTRFVEHNLVANPQSFAFLLRSVVDKDLAKKGKGMREAQLDEVVNLFRRVKDQTIAVMLDENLRNGYWGKRLDEISLPIAAGSYLSRQIESPLISNQSELQLRYRTNGYGPQVATIGCIDKEGLFGSRVSATHGLRQVYSYLFDRKPMVVVGGHMPKAGIARFHDDYNPETNSPGLVAPGWFSEYVDTGGKGNVSKGARPGQAIIIMPANEHRKNLFFLGASECESRDIMHAATLMVGLRNLGLTEKVMSKTSVRRRTTK